MTDTYTYTGHTVDTLPPLEDTHLPRLYIHLVIPLVT